MAGRAATVVAAVMVATWEVTMERPRPAVQAARREPSSIVTVRRWASRLHRFLRHRAGRVGGRHGTTRVAMPARAMCQRKRILVMSWQHWMKDHRTIGTTDFMPDVSLPPWLSVNPAQSAEVFLHAYGAGAGAGASARAASQRDEELAFHEQQAQQLDAIRQQEQQLATEKFGLDLREKQRAAEREAQEAAMQLEGQQQLSKALAQGTPIHEALAAAGPKLFYR